MITDMITNIRFFNLSDSTNGKKMFFFLMKTENYLEHLHVRKKKEIFNHLFTN